MRILLISILISVTVLLSAQNIQRNELQIPNISGFLTLKCDFHIHTYYSDGEVLPDVRVREAWQEGLDAIAITDHGDWWSFSEGEYADRNKPYNDALHEAQKRDIILVKAIELTKPMPPGHINLLFLEDVNKIDKEDYKLALKEAKKQNAFIFWNHPGWKNQAPDGIKWYNEHTEMLENGWMDGIEIVNWDEWYPTAFDWALSKNLTLVGNSDIHMPLNDYKTMFDLDRRPMTLVFVKEKTEEGLKEALMNGRTILWFGNLIIGKKELSERIIKESIKIKSVKNISENRYFVIIQNKSDFPFLISGINGKEENLKLSGCNSIGIYVDSDKDITNLDLKLENVKISGEEVLETNIRL